MIGCRSVSASTGVSCALGCTRGVIGKLGHCARTAPRGLRLWGRWPRVCFDGHHALEAGRQTISQEPRENIVALGVCIADDKPSSAKRCCQVVTAWRVTPNCRVTSAFVMPLASSFTPLNSYWSVVALTYPHVRYYP
jgi:hypothetical protein